MIRDSDLVLFGIAAFGRYFVFLLSTFSLRVLELWGCYGLL